MVSKALVVHLSSQRDNLSRMGIIENPWNLNGSKGSFLFAIILKCINETTDSAVKPNLWFSYKLFMLRILFLKNVVKHINWVNH